MTTHSSILAWRIPWTEEPGGLSSIGSQEWDMTLSLLSHLFLGLCNISESSCHLADSRESMEKFADGKR